MKRITIIALLTLSVIFLAVVLAGMYKFNYLANQPSYDVDGNKIPEDWTVCGSDGNQYSSAREASDAGLAYGQFGATYCPEYKMHPSWDADRDGLNDCQKEGSCDSTKNYSEPRNSADRSRINKE